MAFRAHPGINRVEILFLWAYARCAKENKLEPVNKHQLKRIALVDTSGAGRALSSVPPKAYHANNWTN